MGVEVKKRKVQMKDAVDAAPLQPTAAIYDAALAGASDQVWWYQDDGGVEVRIQEVLVGIVQIRIMWPTDC